MPRATDESLHRYYADYVKIPEYQREFAWDAVLATQLFDSFNQFLIANPQIAGPAGPLVGPAPVAPPIDRFYLGTIITVDKNPIPISGIGYPVNLDDINVPSSNLASNTYIIGKVSSSDPYPPTKQR